MIGRKMAWRMGVLALATACVHQVRADQLTLQHTNEIDLSGLFFGPGNHGVGSPSSGYGSNPLSIAFDGTNAYVGGYNQFGTADNVGVVELPNVLAPSVSPAVNFASTQVSAAVRGINDITYDPSTQRVYYAFDSGSTATSLIARLNPGTGTLDWTTVSPNGQRPVALAIDPKGANGSAAVAYLARGSGRELTLDPTTGAPGFTISGGSNQGPVINGSPAAFGSTWRSLTFDAAGNIASATGSNTGASGGTGGVLVGTRAANTQFNSLSGTMNAQSDSVTKTSVNENVGNGVALLPGILPGTSGINSDVLVFAAPTITANNFVQTIQDVNGNSSIIDTRAIQLRTVSGPSNGITQTALSGGEDDLGAAFTGDLKNFAVGTDVNGQPVLISVDFVGKRLDIWSVEPTWTAGNGTISAQGNWQMGIVPNSQMMNAKFNAQSGPTSINVPGTFVTKDLKIDSATGNYSFNGTGAIQLNGPDNHTANFQILSGNHTIGVGVSLVNAGGTDAVISSGASLTINGAIGGTSPLNIRGAGTLYVNSQNDGTYNAPVSIFGGTVVINADNELGNPNQNLTISGGTLFDTGGFNTSRNLVIGTGGATIYVASGTEARSGSFGGSGSVTKTGEHGTLEVSPFTVTGLTVAAGTMRIRSGVNNTSVVTSFSVGDNTSAPGATLDLNDEDLAIKYSGSASPIDMVRTLLTSGFNAGNWNGYGIASTAAANDPNHHTAIGYAENSDLQYSVFGTAPVDDTSLLLKYTYYGDNNLDGVVDANDFGMFLDGLAGSGSDWERGDYTYDGTVDLGNDFNLFLGSYLAQGGQLGDLVAVVNENTQLSGAQRAALLAVVPEPASAGLMVAAMLSVLGRRKRNRGGVL